MHGSKPLTFWQHHALTAVIAVLIVTTARVIGRAADMLSGTADALLHSCLLVALGATLLTGGAYAAMRYGPDRLPLNIRAVLGCVLIAPLCAVFSPLMSWAIGIGPEPIINATTRADFLTAAGNRYPFILGGYAVLGSGLWMIMNFPWWRSHFSQDNHTENAAAPDERMSPDQSAPSASFSPSAEHPLFFDKLPVAKRGDLWALSSELHYVRVYTSRGHDLVLMRLSDAILQCEGVAGMQVHRSHWVATQGVERLTTKGGKLHLQLKNEVNLPVSRSYIGAVRSAFG